MGAHITVATLSAAAQKKTQIPQLCRFVYLPPVTMRLNQNTGLFCTEENAREGTRKRRPGK